MEQWQQQENQQKMAAALAKDWAADYITAAAPKGAMSYTAQSLGVT